MKTVICNIINTIVSFVKAHTVIAIVTASAVVVTAVAVPVGVSIAKNNKVEATPEKVVSSEPVDDTTSSDVSEPKSVGDQEVADVSSEKQDVTEPERVEKEESAPVATIEEEPAVAVPNPIQTYEENKRKHEEEVKNYLEENHINVNTSGETGETCVRCGKKLWNPNKYGLGNPGYPENFEDSGYCTGACGIELG